MRILIAGGRDFDNFAAMTEYLQPYRHKVSCVISGAAKGADRQGEQWARLVGVPVEEYPALWDVHGRSAGAIRNQLMLTDGKPDLVVVFPGGRGSAHMAAITKKSKINLLQPVWKLV